MAFTTKFQRKTGGLVDVYNVDFPVGAGARGNRPTDIMLVQALFRIMHFEVSKPTPPPAGDKSIVVDGKLGPQTMRFILNAQRGARAAFGNVRLDGIVDPFRRQLELSHLSKSIYVLEVINATCAAKCRDDGIDNFSNLANRDDIPDELRGELSLPTRTVARAYENEA